MKSRPTHAKASKPKPKTPKDLSEAFRLMNLNYKRADRLIAESEYAKDEGKMEEYQELRAKGIAYENEAIKWSKEHSRLLNKYYGQGG